MKLFFKEPEEERKEKIIWTRNGLKVVILSIAATTTDKQSSNCEFSLFFNFHLSHFSNREFSLFFNFHISLFSNSEFTQYHFPYYSPALSCSYGGAFRERYGENVTHSRHLSHLFSLKSYLYIHFSSPLQSTLFSSQSFIL